MEFHNSFHTPSLVLRRILTVREALHFQIESEWYAHTRISDIHDYDPQGNTGVTQSHHNPLVYSQQILAPPDNPPGSLASLLYYRYSP